MRYFDSHAHYYDERFESESEVCSDELISSLFDSCVSGIINVGTSPETSRLAIEGAKRYPGMYTAIGIHPSDSQYLDMPLDDALSDIESLIKNPESKCIALGEIGLDYHWVSDNKEQQKAMFKRQLELAVESDMPVIIHERDCVADCLEIVLQYDVRGVFHAFSGSKETAKILLDRGWYISFPGTVTFKNAKYPPENAVYVPADRILTETDAPYLTPHPFRGKRNDSGYMKHTLQKIADLREISYEELERITEENAKRLFRI